MASYGKSNIATTSDVSSSLSSEVMRYTTCNYPAKDVLYPRAERRRLRFASHFFVEEWYGAIGL